MSTATAARKAARHATTSTVKDRQLFGVLLACFLLSGFAALLYQTVWMRQFAIVFGTSELAIATVLAAYMAGLAIGAAVAGRWAHRLKRPVLAYGLLEFGVAAGALCVPFGMRLAQSLLVMMLGGQAEPPDAGGLSQPLFFAAAAFVVMSIPTVCMGATLPLLTGHVVRRSEEIGQRVGLLYAINTFGAVIGTLAAAFVLIPHTGLFLTTLFGVVANAGVFGLAVLLSRRESGTECTAVSGPATAATPRRSLTEEFSRRVAWILPVMLMSGLVSFMYEVLWSRLLGQLIGGSLYAFATMLATFLTGITVGSVVAARLARNRTVSVWAFALTQLGTAILSMLTYQSLGMVPTLADSWGAGALGTAWVNAALCGVVLLPSTLCIGATFPLAVRILAEDEHDAAPASARVYAWNTIGGVAGAFLAGFFILPALEFDGTIRLAT
ncbi:MAG: fused MFS/spermidine synthase, partial [Maioricimonas sp. JB049]